jgi:hypothetical protein
MTALEAFNHGNGTITVFIREQAHIDWLRSRGVLADLALGDVLLASEDRRKVYPSLTEAIQDSGAIARYLETMDNDYQDSVALTGKLS